MNPEFVPTDNISAAVILNPSAANGDVGLVGRPEPHPEQPNIAYYLSNMNTSTAVAATVRWVAHKQFTLTSIDGTMTREFDSQEQEIRVPPGGSIFVGRQFLYKPVSSIDPNLRDKYTRQFTIEGAQYTNVFRDPLPNPADIRSFLFLYHGPEVEIALNMNMQFGIDAFLNYKDRSGNLLSTEFSTVPGGQSGFWSAPYLPAFKIDFNNSKFFRL